MNKERYAEIMNERKEIAKEEWNEGWHFCVEWDYLLVGPGMAEEECCRCKRDTDGTLIGGN